MITIEVSRNTNKEITNIIVSGHSGYDEIGKDIVCSAVSTAMYITVNLIMKLTKDYKYHEDADNAIMNLTVTKHTTTTILVLDNLIDVLTTIASDYSDYLKITNK